MNSLLCPLCGQRNDSTGHICWVYRPEPTTISPYMPPTIIDVHRLTMQEAVDRLNAQDKRIAELEARELGWAKSLLELEKENQRLREAANRVLYALLPGKVVHMGHEHVRYSATYSVVGWNPILSLAALLGGGDE